MQVIEQEESLKIRNKLFCGNTLEILQSFPDECIDCVITSPPYWGLRNYQSEPQIWDGVSGCEHVFNPTMKKMHNGRGDAQKSAKFSEQQPIPDMQVQSWGFCQICNAWKGELGLEPTFQQYIAHLIEIFDEVRRVLKKEGSCWVNLGDSFDKNKSLCMIPERFAIAMIDSGWILRNKIVWQKPNAMPSSAKDRFGVDWEYFFFFTKSKKYFFETQYQPSTEDFSKRAIKRGFNPEKQTYMEWYYNDRPKKGFHDHSNDRVEGMMQKKQIGCLNSPLGSIKRSVWKIPTKAFKKAHFAVFTPKLIETPIRACCPRGICQKCGHFRKLLYEEVRVNTRPGLDTGNGKSGTEADPNQSLHNSELSRYRQQITRYPRFGGNRAGEYGNPTYSGKEWSPVLRRLKSMGGDQNGNYFGLATKDYRSHGAQNASEVKRRILAGYKRRAGLVPVMTNCEHREYQPGICLDPFIGSGTTALVCMREDVDFVGIDVKDSYIQMAKDRLVEERLKIIGREFKNCNG